MGFKEICLEKSNLVLVHSSHYSIEGESGKMYKEKVEEKLLTNLVGPAAGPTLMEQLLVHKPPNLFKV